MIYSMKSIAPTAACVLGVNAPAETEEKPILPVTKELGGSRHLALLVHDGLGFSTWKLWRSKMPFLSSLHERNSAIIESIMPSITPVNFACMLTGTELAVHGMKTREMDFQCETLFDVVRKDGKKSAGAGEKGYSGELLLARCADFP